MPYLHEFLRQRGLHPENSAISPSNVDMLTEADVGGVEISEDMVDRIFVLNTPDELLLREAFGAPNVIRPDTIPTSGDLFANRDRIRRLELVPEKTEEMRDYYHGYTREDDTAGRLARQVELAREVEAYFTYANNFAFAPNMYPYNLPPDVSQYIAWMKQMDTPRRDTARFISSCIQALGVSLVDLIVFERSLKTTVKRVRGSFPVYRHVHVWMRNIK